MPIILIGRIFANVIKNLKSRLKVLISLFVNIYLEKSTVQNKAIQPIRNRYAILPADLNVNRDTMSLYIYVFTISYSGNPVFHHRHPREACCRCADDGV